jgi:hypothetical protein
MKSTKMLLVAGAVAIRPAAKCDRQRRVGQLDDREPRGPATLSATPAVPHHRSALTRPAPLSDGARPCRRRGRSHRLGSAQLCALRIGHVVEGIDRAARRDEDHPGHDEDRHGEPCDGEQRTSRSVIGS